MSNKITLPVDGYAGSGFRIIQPARVQTTDGSTTSIFTLSPPTNSNVTIFAIISGSQNDDSAGCGGTVMGVYRRGTGNVTGVGTTTDSKEDDGSGTPAISITSSGANILIQVAGLAAETWNWTCGGFYVITGL